MSKFRIISSIPGSRLCGYKAQIKKTFLFWKFWVDVSPDWRWSISDCENDIKCYKGEINNVVKEFKG